MSHGKQKLKNKVIVITGASSGLGEQIAYLAAEEGARIALVSRTLEDLEKVRMKIQRTGGNAQSFVCDISDIIQIRDTKRQIQDHFGHIDILINNAGIWTDDELEQKDSSLREKALMTNSVGTINMTEEWLPELKNQNSGHIVNVISSAGLAHIPESDSRNWKVYGASKWAISGYTKSLREDLHSTKVKITAFFPGGFDSLLYEKAERPNAHNQPWMMKAADLAEMVIFAITRPVDVCLTEMTATKVY